MLQGQGDFAHAQFIAQKLKKEFPNATYDLITYVEPRSRYEKSQDYPDQQDLSFIEKITKLWSDQFGKIYLVNPKFEFGRDKLKALNSGKLDDTTKSILLEADLICEVPVKFDNADFEELIKSKKSKVCRIREYDDLYRQQDCLELGLREGSIGIHVLEEMKISKPLEQLESVKLKELLFSTSSPSAEQVKQYKEGYSLYFGYIHGMRPIGRRTDRKFFNHITFFLNLIVAIEFNDKKSIDVCLPILELGIDDWQVDLDFLKEQGIGKIQLTFTEGESLNKEVVLNSSGKTMRIINCFPLSSQDFKSLVSYTMPIVGCTGDMSFSEVVSAGKFPFYEDLKHKADFRESFFQKIRNRSRYGLAIYRIINLIECTIKNDIHELLKLYPEPQILESRDGDITLRNRATKEIASLIKSINFEEEAKGIALEFCKTKNSWPIIKQKFFEILGASQPPIALPD